MLDYDAAEDVSHGHGGGGRSDASERLQSLIAETLRFLVTATVGVGIGVMGYAISTATRALIAQHVQLLDSLMTRDSPITAFVATLSFSLVFTGLAALCVSHGSWHVMGSGVGKLNAFLSGVSSARSLTLRTLLFKVVGLVCSVASGMKLGMEGPFIHLGAMMGLHISHLLLGLFRIVLPPLGLPRHLLRAISGVKDERVFISGGAAAGFSVAFNAPIAGLLYVQDGASAYWNGEYTFRSFICTMVAVTTLNLCYVHSSGSLPSRGLIDLEDQPPTTIYLAEFWGFALLGVMGGLLGALFTGVNLACEKRRLFYLGHKRFVRLVDALVCSAGAVLLSFSLPFLFPCVASSGQCASALRCLRFQCGPAQFSPLSTLFFTVPEEGIRLLFDRQFTASGDALDVGVLSVFCVAYFLLAALSYGSAVPGGLFIPSIVIGATYGRIVGILTSAFVLPSASSGISVNPGVYAVLGAASMLGGVTRMTLPISVMMIEITSDAQFLIPIMLVVLLAKVVADQCVGALYSEHLRMEGLLMTFGDRIPRTLRSLKAREMMNRGGVVQVAVLETRERLSRILSATTHNAFPVVDLDSRLRRERRSARSRAALSALQRSHSDVREGEETAVDPVFLGLIQRRHLLLALHSQPRSRSAQTSAEVVDSADSRPRTPGTELGSPALAPQPALAALPSFSSLWPSFPFSSSSSSASAPPSALSLPPSSSSVSLPPPLLDLSVYVDEGAYIVGEEMSARRVWALFRSLGMRHLVVLSKRHQPVGMITRRDAIMHAVADIER